MAGFFGGHHRGGLAVSGRQRHCHRLSRPKTAQTPTKANHHHRTLGAVLVRVLFVFFALQLLKIKGISIFGGLILFYVAWRLIVPPKNAAQKTPTEADNLWAAIKTILIADTIMGLDNILAIAGASRGDLTLVIIGFLISIPIMMGGSVIILKCLKKRRGLLAWAADYYLSSPCAWY